MTDQRVAGLWNQIRGKALEQWGALTEDDLKQLKGHAEQLAGKLQERYGLARAEAERQAREFRNRVNWDQEEDSDQDEDSDQEQPAPNP
jgi:uncharacterized protein YjbJ (UPF0337 family)